MGDAAWLQQQHDTMTWLGGDVYRAHSERSIGWGQGVNAQDPPSRLALYRPPEGTMNLARLNDWIWWLGYGPSFTQFVGKGWFYSLAGAGLLLICVFGYSWRRDTSQGRKLLRWLSLQSGILVVLLLFIAVLPVILSKFALQQARDELSKGEYQKCYDRIIRAGNYLPTLWCDTGVMRQMGYLEYRLQRDSEGYVDLYQIYQYERDGYYQRARQILIELSERYDALPQAVQREVLRQHLRVAINEINSNREQHALERLDFIMQRYSCAIQALFHAQLIELKLGNLEGVKERHHKLLNIYRGIKSKNKRGVLAVSYLLLAQAELEAGNTAEAAEARRKSKGL